MCTRQLVQVDEFRRGYDRVVRGGSFERVQRLARAHTHTHTPAHLRTQTHTRAHISRVIDRGLKGLILWPVGRVQGRDDGRRTRATDGRGWKCYLFVCRCWWRCWRVDRPARMRTTSTSNGSVWRPTASHVVGSSWWLLCCDVRVVGELARYQGMMCAYGEGEAASVCGRTTVRCGFTCAAGPRSVGLDP